MTDRDGEGTERDVGPARGVGSVLETCLYVEDLEKGRRFYRRLLGREPFSASEGRHVFFRVGRGVFLLFNPEVTKEASGGVPPHGAKGEGHVAFAVPGGSIPRWRDHLEAEGIPVESEVRWPGGGLSLYIRDPAGNSVELAEPSIWGIGEEGLFGEDA